jgi:CBS domain-containing protein
MSYEVHQLLTNLEAVVAVSPDDSIHDALSLMLQYDYSQLPVVSDNGQAQRFYLLTTDAILAALNNFGVTTTGGLRVKDAMVKVPQVYFAHDDLFELLQGMRGTGAALIVDENQSLTHIVTSYDTAAFFRQWAEDLMRARDVENCLKRCINAAFKTSDGVMDEEARNAAIEDITSSNKQLRKKFTNALSLYLRQQAEQHIEINPTWAGEAFLSLIAVSEGMPESIAVQSHTGSSLNSANTVADQKEPPIFKAGSSITDNSDFVTASQQLKKRFETALSFYLQKLAEADVHVVTDIANTAFEELLDTKEKIMEFKNLSLDSFIKLFFHENCWPRCHDVFGIDQSAVRFMLTGVRDTRNKLAHFREDEITTSQRTQLYSCADWLSNREKSVISQLEKSANAPTCERNPQSEAPVE